MSKAEEAALQRYAFREVTAENVKLHDEFQAGYEQAEKDLGWHSVDECLPEIDEEVIVLTNVIHGKEISSARYICYGHIVNKKYCVDYDGWNIPGVKYWMKCPKL